MTGRKTGPGATVIDKMSTLSRLTFACASIILMMLSLALIAYGLLDLIASVGLSRDQGRDAVLQAVSYVVIAIAVFDVAKFFVEEEVIHTRSKKTLSEARMSLTKFITTIIIAIFIEGLVGVFEASGKYPEKIIYPAILVFCATFIVIALGIYQKLSISTEVQRKEKNIPE
ncbi:hypothetical protein [Gluconacetobacter azotocaptans]|nr:hypothetical protein [Gluconacetobacter azotocaptans]GBQ28271.1 hypothetical protein AA13594_0928 [Gluconacetobacter azotocaptans DSM 13594]